MIATVRFVYGYPTIRFSGLGVMSEPKERLCYLIVRYDHFEAGQRYRLEARNLAYSPSARLYNAKREIVAEDRQANCLM